ncbi:cathepsin L-like [Eupeodes corollae]|uniref:cathepsin L-like n=1 Tax=Eupeodes corollae TaxID=290404 RepID=UPI00248FEC19|nr:cathepsin L-like [Eupeodes corollae]
MMELKLTLLIVATLVAYAASWSCTESDWAKYKEEYNKEYDSAEIDLYHKNTFCENLINIIQNNQDYEIGEVNHKLSVTTFTDLSPTEQEEYRKSHGFKRRRGGYKPKPIEYEEEQE